MADNPILREVAKTAPTGDEKHPWGVFLGDELFGWSKNRFDCDFATNVINDKGLDVYLAWQSKP